MYVRDFLLQRRQLELNIAKKTMIITYLSILALSQLMQSINLNNKPSPDLQLTLNLPKFSSPVSSQLPVLLQR